MKASVPSETRNLSINEIISWNRATLVGPLILGARQFHNKIRTFVDSLEVQTPENNSVLRENWSKFDFHLGNSGANLVTYSSQDGSWKLADHVRVSQKGKFHVGTS